MSHHFGKLVKKNCELCGKEFDTDNKNIRFCSIKCANVYRGKLRRKEEICKMCGKKFYSHSHNLFCSKDCKHEWKVKQEEIRKNKPKIYKDYDLVCEECGHKFISHNKRARFCSLHCASTHNNRHLIKYRKCKYCGELFHKKSMWGVVFCSDGCRKKYNDERRNHLEEIRTQEWIKSHTKICSICGKSFIAKSLTTSCCSETCYKKYACDKSREYSKSKHKKKIVECKNCGIVFETEYGDKRSVFCCRECCKHFNHSKRYEKEHYRIKRREDVKKRSKLITKNYVGPVSYKKLYKRANGICQICGLPVLPKGVDDYWSGSIDHINPLSLGGEHSMSNCQLTHRICNSIKLQNKDEFKIDWKEKIKQSDYWKKLYDRLIDLLKTYQLGASIS